MNRLETIFNANTPVDCHILKGRLDTDGVDSFIFDENIVWVYPFYAVAVGGVKLKVPSDQVPQAVEIVDDNGHTDWSEEMGKEILRQNEILRIRSLLRVDASLFGKERGIESHVLSQTEIDGVKESELKFRELSEKKFIFNWKQFWYELFDPGRNFFDYLRPRPVDYFLENDLVTNYNSKQHSDPKILCPDCGSENVYFGNATGFKLDVLYIILSVLICIPFPLYRKNYHCFDCGSSFRSKKEAVDSERDRSDPEEEKHQ